MKMTKDNIKFLEALKLSEITVNTSDLMKVFKPAASILKKVLSCTAVSFLINEENLLKFYYVSGGKRSVKNIVLKKGEGLAGWSFKNLKSVIVNKPSADPRMKKDIQTIVDYPVNNIIVCPLKWKNKVYGVVEVLNKKNKADFTQTDLKFLKICVNQISVLLRNSEVYGNYLNKISNLKKISTVSARITSSLELKELMDIILKVLKNVLASEASSLLLVSKNRRYLYFYTAHGGAPEIIKKIRLKMGEGIGGYTAKTGKPVIVNNIRRSKLFFKGADEKTKFKTRNLIAYPLIYLDKVIGVMEVMNKKEGSFNKDDMEALRLLSPSIAVALQNSDLYTEQKKLFLNVIEALAFAIDAKDSYTSGHSRRVTEFSKKTAEILGFSPEKIEEVKIAGYLHDIGKIGVKDSILLKPGRLNDKEWVEMKNHSEYGVNILKHISQLQKIIPYIRHHHERYDGNGYPLGLKGKKIPLVSRIIALADSFDAMTSKRVYREKWPQKKAAEEIIKCAGGQFDPALAKVFVTKVLKEKI